MSNEKEELRSNLSLLSWNSHLIVIHLSRDVKLLSFGADEGAEEEEEPVVFRKKPIARPDRTWRSLNLAGAEDPPQVKPNSYDAWSSYQSGRKSWCAADCPWAYATSEQREDGESQRLRRWKERWVIIISKPPNITCLMKLHQVSTLILFVCFRRINRPRKIL